MVEKIKNCSHSICYAYTTLVAKRLMITMPEGVRKINYLRYSNLLTDKSIPSGFISHFLNYTLHLFYPKYTLFTPSTNINFRNFFQYIDCYISFKKINGRIPTLKASLMPPLSAMFSPCVLMPFTCAEIKSNNILLVPSKKINTSK